MQDSRDTSLYVGIDAARQQLELNKLTPYLDAASNSDETHEPGD